jgi:hypothetical protein
MPPRRTLAHRRRQSLTWVEGGPRARRRRKETQRQRSLIKAANFAGEEGARTFPTSRTGPRKPPAAAPNRLPCVARSRAPKKRTLASFPHSQAEVPLLHRGAQATERASVPKHGRCSLGAQPGRWTTLPNTPLVARVRTYLLKSPCWALPHARAHHA